MDMTKIAAALSAIDPSLDTQYSSVAEALMGDAAGNYQYGMIRDRLQGKDGGGANLPTAASLAASYGAPIDRVDDLGESGVQVYFNNGRSARISLDGTMASGEGIPEPRDTKNPIPYWQQTMIDREEGISEAIKSLENKDEMSKGLPALGASESEWDAYMQELVSTGRLLSNTPEYIARMKQMLKDSYRYQG